MVENANPRGTTDIIQQQTLNLGVIRLLDTFFIREVDERGGRDVGEGLETMGLEGVEGFLVADVGDGDGEGAVAEVSFRVGGGWGVWVGEGG